MESLDLQKNRTSRTAKIQREIVYIICSESMDLQKIENLELQKFNGKLCTLLWNVGICRKNEYPEQQKFKVKLCTLYMYGTSGFAEKLNFQNYENSTGNCVHYMCTKKSGFAKNLNIQNCENSTGNCVHYICTECCHLKKI